MQTKSTSADIESGVRRGGSIKAVILGAALLLSCGGSQVLETHTVHLRCDSQFNEGMLLPVDIVFVPKGEKLETITQISPDDWFDSKVRESWPHKQSLSVLASDVRKSIRIDLKKPVDTIAAVVIADYREIGLEKPQMVVLDNEASAAEDVFITINGLLH